VECLSSFHGGGICRCPSHASRSAAPPRYMPIWEWAIAGLGFVLVLGSIFYLVYRGLQNSRS
jgi:hypothetical protein